MSTLNCSKETKSITIASSSKRLFSQTFKKLNEFELPEFSGAPFVVDHVDISASLKSMKEEAYAELKNDEYRDYCTQMPKDIAKLLALADVVKVDLVVDSAYDNYFNAGILSKIGKRYKKKIWGPPKRFPSCVKAELEDLISDFEDDCFEDLEDFQDKLSKMRLNQTSPAVKRLISLVSCLADELIAKEKKVGEMQLQTSFVHSLMKAMFKISKDHDAYASNLVFDKDDDMLKNCRPDYLVEVKGTQKNVVGEVKPSGTSKVGVEWDVLRLGIFGCQILSSGGVDAVVCFHVVAKQIKFYVMTKAKNVFLMNHIETITLPFFYSDLKTFPSQLNSIFNIMHIYENFCKPNPSSSPSLTPFPSFEMYKNIYANNKKQKICQ